MLAVPPPAMQLMANPVAEARISMFHEGGRAGVMGLLPSSFPSGGAVCRCAAAVSFMPILVGWLVPTFLVARGESRAALRVAQRCEEQHPRWHPSRELSGWLMDNVFLDDAPAEVAALAWFVLVAMCWLLATLLAATACHACG